MAYVNKYTNIIIFYIAAQYDIQKPFFVDV